MTLATSKPRKSKKPIASLAHALEQMERQRDELTEAIDELKAQLDWGRQLLHEKTDATD